MAKSSSQTRLHHPSFLALKTESPVWVEIHRENLLKNLGVVKRLAGVETGIIAVVKANAYGHGLEIVASTLAPHVHMFAVTRVQEALRLREYGIETPVLVLGPISSTELKTAIQTRSLITISGLREAHDLNAEAERLNRSVAAHVKVDTGMGRLGIPAGTALSEITKITKLSRINVKGLYTHFPSADDSESSFTQKQIRNFKQLVAFLRKSGLEFEATHLSNSSAIVSAQNAGGSLVRPGIMLYGVLPGGLAHQSTKLGLGPVLSWRAKVILVKELQKGETCGYARAFKAVRKTRIAWLPVGYSHGYPFSLSSSAQVLIKGRRHFVAGRISMDFLGIDIGARSDIHAGDVATLIGKDGDEITVSEIAERAKTIPYEIMTGIHPSIPRRVFP